METAAGQFCQFAESLPANAVVNKVWGPIVLANKLAHDRRTLDDILVSATVHIQAHHQGLQAAELMQQSA